MLGAIIGDIIGSRWEFHRTNDYNFELFSEENSFTDDTICTIAIADAILKGRNYGESLHDWCRRYMKPTGGFGGRFRRWVESNNPQPYGSYGNGSAMRVSPVGMRNYFSPIRTAEEAKKSAMCTHNHEEGIKGAVCVAQAIQTAISLCDGVTDSEELKQIAEQIRNKGLANYQYNINVRYEDFRNKFDETCQGTIPPALDIIGRSIGFEDAIRKAVSLGADADTIGAIVGSIAEHIWGIPDQIKAKALTYLTEEMRQVVAEFYDKLERLSDYKPKSKLQEKKREMELVKEFDTMSINTYTEEYLRCKVSGTRYIDDKSVFHTLQKNDILKMKREPDNRYDENAIALYFNDRKIGYIPRKQNKDLSMLLKTGWGKIMSAHVIECEGNPEDKNVTIEINMKRCHENMPVDFDDSYEW